jgi:2-keto-4-pentenoate hydratase/2-oxohepta-3-ene-1,7-dioic acid hydratase in catechol pathway
MHEDICDSLDYETELGVVIGRQAKDVKASDALDYIFGYTIVNDVSARNLQTKHKQWYFGKSLDGFTPMGPCIVSKDEFDGIPELDIKTFVNGELRQSSNTANLITGIPEIIEILSAGMTLEPGTVIATGTPSGVAMGMDPPDFLQDGDEVVCEIEGIGRLVNICKKSSAG